MKSYPIWNDVTSCIYKSDKSFGARDDSRIKISVGSSSTHSEQLADIRTTRSIKGIYYVFKISIDGMVMKTKYFNTKTKEFTSNKPESYD